jgi:hypothetical protein
MTYRGYDVSRSPCRSYWYAIPRLDWTTERKLKADTPELLKLAIDAAISANPVALDPWELPQAQPVYAAA